MLQVKSRVTVRVVVPRIGRRALKAQCCTCLTSFHGHVLLILVFLLAAWFSGSLLSTFFFKVKIKKHPWPGPSVLFGKSTGLLLLCFTCCQTRCALRNCGCLFRGEKKNRKGELAAFSPPLVAEGCCSSNASRPPSTPSTDRPG